MMAATVAVLTPVSRFSSGVYSSVAAAEKAMMARSSGGSCARPNPNPIHTSTLYLCRPARGAGSRARTIRHAATSTAM